MSATLPVPAALAADHTVAVYARDLYVQLLAHTNGGDEFEASLHEIAALTGWVTTTVNKYVRNLEETGWITRHHRRSSGGYLLPTQYVLHGLDKGAAPLAV